MPGIIEMCSFCLVQNTAQKPPPRIITVQHPIQNLGIVHWMELRKKIKLTSLCIWSTLDVPEPPAAMRRLKGDGHKRNVRKLKPTRPTCSPCTPSSIPAQTLSPNHLSLIMRPLGSTCAWKHKKCVYLTNAVLLDQFTELLFNTASPVDHGTKYIE